MSTITRALACLAGLLLVLGAVRPAEADWAKTIQFFSDKGTFEAGLLSSTTVDFEGLVGETGYLSQGSSTVIGGVTFSTVPIGEQDGNLFVAGMNAEHMGVPLVGTPYQSAILLSSTNPANPIKADLSTAGSGFTAVGAFFGDIDSAASSTTLTLRSPDGTILDTQTVTAGNMGQGETETFYGWIVRGDGNYVGSVTHDVDGNFEALDNLTFGDGNPAAVPEPSTLVALLSMLAAGTMVSLAARRRKRAQS